MSKTTTWSSRQEILRRIHVPRVRSGCETAGTTARLSGRGCEKLSAIRTTRTWGCHGEPFGRFPATSDRVAGSAQELFARMPRLVEPPKAFRASMSEPTEKCCHGTSPEEMRALRGWNACPQGGRGRSVAFPGSRLAGHHPDFCVHFTVLDVSLSTHAIGGLSENDFILAAKIDRLQP